MLAEHLTKGLRQLAEDRDMTFAYIFCDYRARERNFACAILRTILWHLITKRPTLIKHAQQCIGEKKGIG
jgi:predicted DNA-binding ribbon-helix-helix protein